MKTKLTFDESSHNTASPVWQDVENGDFVIIRKTGINFLAKVGVHTMSDNSKLFFILTLDEAALSWSDRAVESLPTLVEIVSDITITFKAKTNLG